jgi:hypothetical protein
LLFSESLVAMIHRLKASTLKKISSIKQPSIKILLLI